MVAFASVLLLFTVTAFFEVQHENQELREGRNILLEIVATIDMISSLERHAEGRLSFGGDGNPGDMSSSEQITTILPSSIEGEQYKIVIYPGFALLTSSVGSISEPFIHLVTIFGGNDHISFYSFGETDIMVSRCSVLDAKDSLATEIGSR